jgi:2-polyprenyl-3-methyl-5-hydroxy-6-metoxy-1,4-benzoquinol methylase
MKKINKQNIDAYDIYHQCTKQYKEDFKASGYWFSSQWKRRTALISHLVQLIDLSKLDILDIGCNNGLTGHTLCELLNRRHIENNIDGIDFVEEATLIAKKDFSYRDTFVADITDNDLVDNLLGTRKYEAVMCCEVFHYLHPEDYNSFLTTVYSHLLPHGYFILIFPNVKSIYQYVKKIYYLLSNYQPPRKFEYYFKYKYDLPLVQSLLQENNFDIVSMFGVELLTNLMMKFNKSNNSVKKFISSEYAILSKKND